MCSMGPVQMPNTTEAMIMIHMGMSMPSGASCRVSSGGSRK